MLEPLISIVHAQKAFYELGKESILRPEVDQFLANITTSVHGYVSSSLSLGLMSPQLDFIRVSTYSNTKHYMSLCINVKFIAYLCDALCLRYFSLNYLEETLRVKQINALYLFNLFPFYRVRAEMTEETNRTVELMDAIEQNSLHLYPVEPTPDTPFRAPSDNLTQKGGYLYLRRWG